MPDCPACQAAAAGPAFIFYDCCRGCCARSIARSPQFFEARTLGGRAGRELPAYVEMIERLGGGFVPPLTHDDVKAAAVADAALRPWVTA